MPPVTGCPLRLYTKYWNGVRRVRGKPEIPTRMAHTAINLSSSKGDISSDPESSFPFKQATNNASSCNKMDVVTSSGSLFQTLLKLKPNGPMSEIRIDPKCVPNDTLCLHRHRSIPSCQGPFVEASVAARRTITPSHAQVSAPSMDIHMVLKEIETCGPRLTVFGSVPLIKPADRRVHRSIRELSMTSQDTLSFQTRVYASRIRKLHDRAEVT